MHQLHSLLLPSQSGGASAHCASQFATQSVIQSVILCETLCETLFGIVRANLWNQRAKAWKLEN
jgi:hypothetical protein